MNSEVATSSGPSASAPAAPMLSFDVEEYFQVEAAARTVSRDQWDVLPRRLPAAVDRILELLASHRTVATFFILGWVAEHQRPLVRRIAEAGHEIASHGTDHRMIGRLTPEEFRVTLTDSRRLLEDITGRPVLGYRAPTFSVTRATAWAIDILAEAGYAYDSSVFPVRHDRYGVPDAPRFAHRAVGPGGGSLLEIPPLTWRVLGRNVPVGGGGYLRLLPVRLVGGALAAAARGGHQGMIYLHPWELDPGQPVIAMGRVGTWRHRVNLHRTADKLAWLLGRHRFTSVRDSGLLPARPDLASFTY